MRQRSALTSKQHVPGFAGLEAIEKFSAGQSNPTYLIKAASGRYVLRAKPPGQLLKSAHQVDREFRVMKALAGSGVPVPNVLISPARTRRSAACSTSWPSSTAASSGTRRCRKSSTMPGAPRSTTP